MYTLIYRSTKAQVTVHNATKHQSESTLTTSVVVYIARARGRNYRLAEAAIFGVIEAEIDMQKPTKDKQSKIVLQMQIVA